MAFKKSAVVVLASAAALVFEVGCGKQDNQTQQRMRVNHNLQARSGVGVKNHAQNAKQAALSAKEADQQITQLAATEQQLQSPNPVAIDQLVDGTYELKSVTTVFNYRNEPKEKMSAVDVSTVQKLSNGLKLVSDPSQSKVYGKMTLDTDSVARKIDIASAFTKNKDWKADRDHTTKIMLQNQFTNNTLTDQFVDPADQKISMFGILSSTAPDSTGSYKVQDENGRNVTMRVLRTSDEATLRVYFTIEEKVPDTSNNIAGSSESIYRNVYLDYTITPPTAAQ